MRLMWAGLLVMLPLVAELANAQRCSGEPDAPERATVRCFKKRGTCRAMCESGYFFEVKGARSAIFNCVGGQWEMKNGHEDRCSPVCDPPCQNGDCIDPDTCICDGGFTGDLCDEREYDEDYVTEEPTEGYDDNAYGYDDNEDKYGDEEPNKKDEVALYFHSLGQSVKNWDARDRRHLVHRVQLVFYEMAEAIDERQQPPPVVAC